MKRKTLPTMAMCFVMGLGGCLDNAPSEEFDTGLPSLGLGLEIPDVLPPPGPFREDPENLETLKRFLTETGLQILGECGHAEAARKINASLENEDYRGAIGELIYGCFGDESGALAAKAIQDGNEADVYHRLRAKTAEAIETVRNGISEHPGPGNSVELQVMSILSATHHTRVATLTGSNEGFWMAYESGKARDDLQLRTVYLGLMYSANASMVMNRILEEYPWEGPSCILPDQNRVIDRIESKINLTIEKSNSVGFDPSDNYNHIRLTNFIIPRFEYYREQGWPEGLLSVEGSVERRMMYWESFSDSRWPTLDEAKFMMAQHRNESRTIWQEAQWADYDVYFEDEHRQARYPWDEDLEVGPPAFLGILSLRWPFEAVECSPAEAMPVT